MMRLRNGLAMTALLVLLALPGCGTEEEAATPAAAAVDSLTPEQQRARRDSAIAGSRLPGAGGVGRALDARDAANARSAEHDTLLD